jgi:hypothetical protein
MMSEKKNQGSKDATYKGWYIQGSTALQNIAVHLWTSNEQCHW